MSFEPSKPSGRWSFKDDATSLSQVVRSVERDGPQYVSVEGLGDVVVLSAHEFARLRLPRSDGMTGQALLDTFAASPHRDIDISVERGPLPVRDGPS